MCDHGAASSSFSSAPSPVVVDGRPAVFPEAAPVSSGSRRHRIWELSRSTHCPVVGVCLPLDVLRRVVNKALGGETQATDYDLHVGVVTECGVRNKVSEAVQRELERRCAQAVRHFSRAKTAEAAMALWHQAMAAGDVAGPLWAALSHPRCDAAMQDQLCRDIHMVQHQAGATVRADVRRLAGLTDETRELARQLAEAQARVRQLQAEHALAHDRLATQLVQARVDAIGKHTLIETLRNEMVELRQSLPELQSRLQLSQRAAELTTRNRALDQEVSELRRCLAAQEREARQAERGLAAPVAADPVPPPPVFLGERNILCVGGRHAHIPIYRELVERQGGRFAHHDGGVEDNPHRLDASLAAADLVICQTGCLSHNAYWLVKDHCKRTGKRCVYVDQPSVAGFARSLAQLPQDEPVGP
jgi:hypothetical protein